MAFKNKDKIDVIRDKIKAYKSMQTVPELKKLKKPEKGIIPFMLTILIELVGPEILKEIIVSFLTKGLISAEKSIKNSLKKSLSSDSSSKNAKIPDYLKSNGSGIKIPLKKLDKEGITKLDPNTNEGKNAMSDGSLDKHLQNTANGPGGDWPQSNPVLNTSYDDNTDSILVKANSNQDDKPFAKFLDVFIDSMIIITARPLVSAVVDLLFGTLSLKLHTRQELIDKIKTEKIINKIKDEESDDKIFNFTTEELLEIENQANQLFNGTKEIDLGCGLEKMTFNIKDLNNIIDQLSLIEPQSISNMSSVMDNLGNSVISQNLPSNKQENVSTIKQGFFRKFLEILEFYLIKQSILGPQMQLIFTMVDLFKGNLTIDPNTGEVIDNSDSTTDDIKKRKGLIKNVVSQVKGVLTKAIFETLKKHCEQLKGSIIKKYVKDVFDTYSKQLLGLLGVKSTGIIN